MLPVKPMRSGVWLAVFDALGTSDLHYENMIASGEHPMFIDLETFVQRTNDDMSTGTVVEAFYEAVRRTVLGTIFDVLDVLDHRSALPRTPRSARQSQP